MKVKELLEARRNPEQNPRESGHAAAIEYLHAHHLYQSETAGVRMTDIPKLGINPTSEYNTPLGLCFYPARYYVDRINSGRELPFQHNAQYIQIFNWDNASVLDLTDMSYDQVLAECKKLSEFYDPNAVTAMLRLARTKARIKSPSGHFWFVTFQLSDQNPVKWNKLFRQLGYDVIMDWGGGIIHHNEPTQGVILNPRVISHMNMIQKTHQPLGDYLKKLIGNNPENIKKIEDWTPELAKNIIDHYDGKWLSSIPEYLRTPEICKIAVTKNPIALFAVPEETLVSMPELSAIAVKQDPKMMLAVPDEHRAQIEKLIH